MIRMVICPNCFSRQVYLKKGKLFSCRKCGYIAEAKEFIGTFVFDTEKEMSKESEEKTEGKE